MDMTNARQQVVETCQQIGAAFTLEEAEGELRAFIIKDSHHWWSLIEPCDSDGHLWRAQLCALRQHR